VPSVKPILPAALLVALPIALLVVLPAASPIVSLAAADNPGRSLAAPGHASRLPVAAGDAARSPAVVSAGQPPSATGTDRSARAVPAAQASAAVPAAQASAAVPARPRLVVLLVVDQMRADYVEKFGDRWTGGLRRLVDEGAWFRQAAYRYMSTVTCVGHSSIATGPLPRPHGIVANDLWDGDTGTSANCVADPETTLVSYGRPVAGPATSTRKLRVPVLADELRAQLPVPPRIVTLSMKDYTATVLAGRRADAVVWVSAAAGAPMTSSAFTAAPVPFVADFVRAHPIDADFGKTWTRLLPPSAYLHADDAEGERTPAGWTRTFPHALAGGSASPDRAFYDRWIESPFSDDYLGRLAEASVDALKLGQGPGTDYLAVSFSALDVVGHDFGPRSHEAQDVLARLDRTIGSLVARLDARVGRDRYVLALTADHGVSPVPEQMAALGLDAERILTPDVVARVDQALARTLGPDARAARMVYEDLFLAPGVYDRLRADPRAMRAVVDAAAATPGVARVFTSDQLAAARRGSADDIERAAAASFYPGRSGDLIVVPRPYYQFAASAARRSGTTHGSPYWYDRRVPLFLLGRGIKPGHYLDPAEPVDIAPTLAFLCGITLPAADGRVLHEAMRNRN
jgi:predicted AlkP superfamily pyrophosphatase or phosphodiesterase